MRRGALAAGIGLTALVVGFALFTIVGLGGGGSESRGGTASTPRTPDEHLTAVQLYSAEISVREAGGSQTLSEEPPISPARFAGPIRAYRRYAARQAALLQRDVRHLDSRGAWRLAFARYLRLGAVYGAFDGVDIDAQFRRLERGLWRGTPVSTAPLAAAVARLRRAIPRAEITPVDYATRAHEILEDAQRDYLSGVYVPFSGEGVLATDSGVDATRAVITTLLPVLGGQDALDPVLLGLSRLSATLAAIRHAHGGRLPTLGRLGRAERERLDGSVSWALERLQRIPGGLETTDPVQIPRLP